MENTIHPLLSLFKISTFCIPQYQRAYTWDVDPQLTAFIADLRQQAHAIRNDENKSYFLGTLLLHDVGDGKIHVVDGQQRLTTAVTFIAAALKRYLEYDIFPAQTIKPGVLRRAFIFDDDEDIQKFQTISEDNPFFQSQILGLTDTKVTENSPSSHRLRTAFDYFFDTIDDHEWEELVSTLITAKVMVYSVSSSADATLIFELQNDRGKKLTDLEALKSYLMHLVYLHAKKPEDRLAEIQTHFSNIYRIVEQLSGIKKAPTEDAILSYHCAAYLDWTNDEWRNPKTLIKKIIKNTQEEHVTTRVLDFIRGLHETFKTVQHLLLKLDDYSELTELIILDRMGTVWPLVMKSYSNDIDRKKKNFRLACRLMEIYAFKGYGICNLRSDAGLSSMYRFARDFQQDFESLHTFLYSMSSWYDIPARWQSGLDRPMLYKSNRRDVQYLLWKYENHLRSATGQQVGHLPWQQYLFPDDKASKLSIEHIAAQNNPISHTEVEWEQGEQKSFHEVCTHRLGNLVLDSISANSSKGKYDFSDKLESLSKDSTFLSQGELIDWAEKDQVGESIWTIESIKKRHNALIYFAMQTWDANRYFIPKDDASQEEEPIDYLDTEN